MKRKPSSTLPLEHFVEEWVDDESIPLEEEKAKPQADDELTLIDYFSDEIEE